MIGPIIPPSITMVIYGVVSNTSIGQMFLGGVVPGLLCALALMVMVYVIARRRNYPVSPRASLKQIAKQFVWSFPALLTPFIIVGGIFSGEFSPTEAAAITAIYAILLGLFVYRDLTWSRLWSSLYETMVTTASIGTIIAGVSLFGVILARQQAPQQVAAVFLQFTSGPVSFLIAVNVLIFVPAPWSNRWRSF